MVDPWGARAAEQLVGHAEVGGVGSMLATRARTTDTASPSSRVVLDQVENLQRAVALARRCPA